MPRISRLSALDREDALEEVSVTPAVSAAVDRRNVPAKSSMWWLWSTAYTTPAARAASRPNNVF
jgi:hypothetical protein